MLLLLSYILFQIFGQERNFSKGTNNAMRNNYRFLLATCKKFLHLPSLGFISFKTGTSGIVQNFSYTESGNNWRLHFSLWYLFIRLLTHFSFKISLRKPLSCLMFSQQHKRPDLSWFVESTKVRFTHIIKSLSLPNSFLKA